MSNKLFHVPSTSSLRPDMCPSRSSLDSGFESSKSKNSLASSPGSCEESLSISSTTVSPLALKSSKRPKLELDIASISSHSSTPQSESEPIQESRQPTDLAVKLINSCTSPKSTANVRRLLLYCTPSTSALPAHGKRADLKSFIADKFGDKTEQDNVDNDNDKLVMEKGTHGESECFWGNCGHQYETDNELYDHLIDDHLSLLHPRSLNESPESKKREYICQWDDCEMSIARGDAMKKHDWLVSHVTLKHMPQAQPYKCIFEDCVVRFRTTNQLSVHCKVAHRENAQPQISKVKKSVEKSSKTEDREAVSVESKQDSAFNVMYRKRMPEDQLQDNLDRRMFDWLHNVQVGAHAMENPCLMMVDQKDYSKVKGAARRKLHKNQFIAVVDAGHGETPQQKPCSPKLAQLYLRDVFPQPTQVPQCKPQQISLEGVRCQLVKKCRKRLIKSIINNDNKRVKVFDAQDHGAITDLTFGDEGRKLMAHWIKLDDAEFGTHF